MAALALLGAPQNVIAARTRLHPVSVSRILSEPDMVARLDAARATAFRDAQAILRQACLRAAHVLVELVEHESGHVALRAAVAILTKAGADAPKALDLGALAGAADADLWTELEALRSDET